MDGTVAPNWSPGSGDRDRPSDSGNPSHCVRYDPGHGHRRGIRIGLHEETN